MRARDRVLAIAIGISLAIAGCAYAAPKLRAGAPVFSISFPRTMSAAPINGRLMLLLSTDPSDEPRNQISTYPASQIAFGETVDGMTPGRPETVTASKAFGWPIQNLKDLKPGDYFVQALIIRYETFHRSDGSVVKLPADQGEGRLWNLTPGNLYSKPVKLRVDPTKGQHFTLSMDQKIPSIAEEPDTEYIKQVTIKSEVLSKFWGRPMYIGAQVLLPAGFDTHPDAHYPLMLFHGHHQDLVTSEFRTTPPDPDLKPDYNDRFHLSGYNRIIQEEAYKSYKEWVSPNFPRFIVIQVKHANPYYDDSYAVNSANLGPYGDAVNKELIPYIEKRFRGLGQGWARFTYGGSTGGWESLATQVFYPDMYNGSFSGCPDPIDFHAFTTIDIYNDKNAYFSSGAHATLEQPGMRNYLGQTLGTQRGMNYYELALGDHGRSGKQYDIWEAVFGPEGSDGYPKPLWDKKSGVINPEVAAYWREHYDLNHIMQRDWATLGPKLKGKIHLYAGRGDTYFLNDAVYLAEDALKAAKDPTADAEFAYGGKDEHCWNGDPSVAIAYSRLHYNMQYLLKILDRIAKTAPPGADLSSWRY